MCITLQGSFAFPSRGRQKRTFVRIAAICYLLLVIQFYAYYNGNDQNLGKGDSLTAIEAEAFSGGAFSYVVLPDGAESIGSRAFADCPKLAYIYIPASVKSIDANAFDGAEGLTIFGAPESAASEYAGQHGFTFAAQQ